VLKVLEIELDEGEDDDVDPDLCATGLSADGGGFIKAL
jgi:hypothetical protein